MDSMVTNPTTGAARVTETATGASSQVEKFSPQDLTNLRVELMRSGLDSWQSADVLFTFLANRGYGIGTREAREAVVQLEHQSCSVDCMQEVLERVARVM